MSNKTKSFFLYFLVFIIIFLIDRVTKVYVINLANISGTVDIKINNYLNIFLIWNTGIGFGLFSSGNPIFYNIITFLILIINLIIVYLIYESYNIKRLIFIIILGGSSGNLFDRGYYSAVPDFIDLNYNGYHWFIFNFADIFISIGIFCLIFMEIFNYKNKVSKQ